jgi:hypothetical protein
MRHTPLYPGQRFGRLTVVKQAPSSDRVRYEFLCDCGNLHVARFDHVTRGSSTSCGCFWREKVLPDLPHWAIKTHKMTKTPEYIAWLMMIQRCTNPKAISWPQYGGRGIKICERWRKFENFYEDMGDRPLSAPTSKRSEFSIGRINNEGNYEPSNCRWETWPEQYSNRRNPWITRRARMEKS